MTITRLRYVFFGFFLSISTLVNAEPIHDAVADGNIDEVKRLIAEGVDVNTPDVAGTALQQALFTYQIDLIRLLLENRANPNTEGSSDTPLLMSIYSGNPELVKLLLEHGGNPNRGDRSTPLIAAITIDNIEIFELLLANEADVNYASADGNTPLHEAVKKKNLDMIKQLVSNSADVNAFNGSKVPPIHIAIRNKDEEAAKFLWEHGVMPREIPSVDDLLANADIEQGEALTKRMCGSCHTFGKKNINNSDPTLWDIVGRAKGIIGDFNYSDALKGLGGVWSHQDLNHFLALPADFIPGTKMLFTLGIEERQLRANMIAYLRTLSDNPVPLP